MLKGSINDKSNDNDKQPIGLFAIGAVGNGFHFLMPKTVERCKGEVSVVISENALLIKVHGKILTLFSDIFALPVITQGCPAKYIKCIELPVEGKVCAIINNPFFQGVVDVKMKLKMHIVIC